MFRWWLALMLLLVLWGTRLLALEALPLHNDEGLHLTRAVEVWNGHPFWQISDGKIINHWLIALFYPQHSPVFVGRVATILIALVGLAAGYRLSRDLFGASSSVLAAGMWITSPYLFFYERLAFSDAEAGALVVVTLLASLRLATNGRVRDAVLTGLVFALAALFKFTAAPFALMVIIVVLAMGRVHWQRRLLNLAVVFATVTVCFVPPLAYLVVRGRDFFTVALDWLGGASGETVGASTSGVGATFGDNLSRLWVSVTGYGIPYWTALILIVGLLLLLALRPRLGSLLLFALLVPLFVIVFFGREVLPRHFVVALPLALVLAGDGLGLAINRNSLSFRSVSPSPSTVRGLGTGVLIILLLLGILPFITTTYLNPGDLPLPDEERRQFITEHSSGYGLREAVSAFPQTITRRDLPIIASMFPDGCRRANFYAASGLAMACPQAPAQSEITAALDERGAVYVLVDTAPVIGLDVTTLDARATRLAAYPRPGESDESATVVLWLLERQTAAAEPVADCSATGEVLPAYTPSNMRGFVRIQDNHFVVGDSDYQARGVNYYPSRYPWRRFLTETDLDSLRAELDLLRGAGFNTLRLFLWNDALFVCPRSEAVPITDAFLRLDSIIHEAAAHGFRLIVTLNDLPDLDEYPLYTNPTHVQEQTRVIVERYHDEAAILAWDLRNEGDIDYGTHVAFPARFAREAVLAWLAQTADFVRGLDPNHLITAGWLNDSESTASAVDFVSFHHWGAADTLRQRIITLFDYTDKPILLEEFGYSTFTMTPDEQSTRIQEIIETAESQDLAGWLIWTAFDFPLDATCWPSPCASADNAEHHFGLWYADYMPKPVVSTLQLP